MPHKDPVERRAYLAAWKLKNQERHRFLNKIADAAMHANRRAAKYGAPGTLTAGDVRYILEPGACHYCGGPDGLGIDHVIPLSDGGPNEVANLVPACHSCNASKWRSGPGWKRQWSRLHAACTECGGTSRRHAARGRCILCYGRSRAAA